MLLASSVFHWLKPPTGRKTPPVHPWRLLSSSLQYHSMGLFNDIASDFSPEISLSRRWEEGEATRSRIGTNFVLCGLAGVLHLPSTVPMLHVPSLPRRSQRPQSRIAERLVRLHVMSLLHRGNISDFQLARALS